MTVLDNALAAGGLHQGGGPVAQYINAGMVSAGYPPLPPAPPAAAPIPPALPVQVIAEDSIFLKIIASVPVISSLICAYQESSLADQIDNKINQQHIGNNKFTVVPNVIRLIEVKNHYIIAGIAGNMIAVAMGVSGIALGTLGTGFLIVVILCAIYLVYLSARKAYNLYNNIQVLNTLQALPPAGGIPAGLQFAVN